MTDQPSIAGATFGAWLGLVPRQISTGYRTILGRISKRGNSCLRMPFVQAARVVLLRPANWPKHSFIGKLGLWLETMSAIQPSNLSGAHRNLLKVSLARSLPATSAHRFPANNQWRMAMKPMHILMLASMTLTAPAISHAQLAGTTVLGVSVAEMREVVLGWSVKHTILGQHVYNDKNERVGTVDDLIVTPDKALSYAIVNVGGFLGLAKHNVAIPVSQLKLVDKKLVLAGATKEALKASPEFQYAH